MTKYTWTRDELMAEDAYARPNKTGTYKLHGGFDAEGHYISPRTRYRWPAVRAWGARLEEKGIERPDASRALLKRGNYPNFEQQILLLNNGMGRTLWDSLTITGLIEARGGALVSYVPPSIADIVEEDISETATAHLGDGLLVAHGMDEAGDPATPDVGAHDAMWFAVRDLLFGAGAYPLAEAPDSISRPQEGPPFPKLPSNYGEILFLMMDVLMIEVRAEAFFDFCLQVMRDKRAFPDKPDAAAEAANLVERIRQDEEIHVAYLQTVISEMRAMTFQCTDGKTRKGAEMMDPVWDSMVRWHGEEQFDLGRERAHAMLREEILARPDGKDLFARFEAYDDRQKAA